MPRDPSTLTKAAMLAEQSGAAFWFLLQLDHPTLAQPLRFCTNNEPLVRATFTWAPTWFQIVLPGEDSDQVSAAQLQVENIDGAILQALLQLTSPLQVKIYIATSADEAQLFGPFEFTWRETTWDSTTLSGSLEPDDLLNENWPKDEFTPTKFPGLFR